MSTSQRRRFPIEGDKAAYLMLGATAVPDIPEGAIIIVRTTMHLEPGTYIAIITKDEGLIVRYFERITNDGQWVLTENRDGRNPLTVDPFTDIIIKGTVIEVRTLAPEGAKA